MRSSSQLALILAALERALRADAVAAAVARITPTRRGWTAAQVEADAEQEAGLKLGATRDGADGFTELWVTPLQPTERVRVAVPPNAVPGGTMRVVYKEREHPVNIPPHAGVGTELEVHLPVGDPVDGGGRWATLDELREPPLLVLPVLHAVRQQRLAEAEARRQEGEKREVQAVVSSLLLRVERQSNEAKGLVASARHTATSRQAPRHVRRRSPRRRRNARWQLA